jgi:hypothetical protein
LKFTPTYDLVDDKNTFTLYLGATTNNIYNKASNDAEYLLVKYEVIDESIITASTSSFWWNDCIDFIINPSGAASGGNEFRIEGTKETTNSSGTAHSLPNYIEHYSVTHTDKGYDIEFIIPRTALTNKNTFSFMAYITAAISTTSRKYPCIENAAYKAAKDKLNYVRIINDICLSSSTGNKDVSKYTAQDTAKISITGNLIDCSANLYFGGKNIDLTNVLTNTSQGSIIEYMLSTAGYPYPYGIEITDIKPNIS